MNVSVLVHVPPVVLGRSPIVCGRSLIVCDRSPVVHNRSAVEGILRSIVLNRSHAKLHRLLLFTLLKQLCTQYLWLQRWNCLR